MAENLGGEGEEARTLGYDSFQNPLSLSRTSFGEEIATWKLVLALLPPPYNPSFNAVNLLVRGSDQGGRKNLIKPPPAQLPTVSIWIFLFILYIP